MGEPKLYTVRQAQVMLQVSRSWLYMAMRRGDIPCVELSPRCLRIPADALTEVLQRKLKDKGNW
jgi:predicted site-specific integrase-resolvase